MARGFHRRGKGAADERFAARLDDLEKAVVLSLLSQTLDLLDPPAVPAPEVGAGSGDAFEVLVAQLGPLEGFGAAQPSADARSFGEQDPALQRLLPIGNRTDELAAAEFRRLTEAGLRRRKAETIERAMTAVAATPDEVVELRRADATALLVALTDVRLVLGERMGLREDADAERLEEVAAALPDDDPVVQVVAVYDFLTWLQETLTHALLERPR